MVGNRREMDYFENHSYWLIRLVLFYTGLWPYADRRTRCLTSSIQILVITMITFSVLFKFIMLFPNVESIIYTLPALTACFLALIMYIFLYIFNVAQLKKLWKLIENDWKELEKLNKIPIAKRYAGKGNLLSLYIAILMITYCLLVYLDLYLPYILDSITKRKQPDRLKIPISVELFGQYDVSATLVLVFCAMLVGIMTAICIVEFIIFMQHACLLFSLTGDMLENGFTNIDEINNATDKDEIIYKAIVESIKYHKAAIGFSKIIEDTYTTICFYVMIVVITLLASSSLRLFHTSLSRNVLSTIISFLFLICTVGIAFVVSHTGQLLIDHSLDVFQKACSVSWYIASFKSQKLLIIILTRAIKPTYVTNGKMAILSHTLFTMLLHSTISVTTVFISM